MAVELVFGLWLTFASVSRGDIIFVDLNRSPKEIAAARAAAKLRKEELHLVPGEPSTEVKARIATLEIKIRNQRSAIDRLSDTRKIMVARQTYQDLLAERKSLSLMNPKIIGEKLDELRTKGRKVSSLIISGHDGNGAFFGENGRLSAYDLQVILKDRADMAKDIRSLYLWGCYTANFGSCEGHWKAGVPNLGIIVGFDGSSPANDKKANHVFLKDSLIKEKKFTEANDEKTIRSVFKSIRSINQVKAAVCINDLVVNNQRITSTKELSAACKIIFAEKRPVKWAERIACYKDGAPGCENVPADTRNGELRKIYEEMQGTSHCREIASDSEDPEMRSLSGCWPDPEELLRLVLFKQVQKNASILHANEFSAYDAAIEAQGLPKSMKLGDVASLSRTELNKRLTDLQVAVAQTTSKPEDYSTVGGIKAAELKASNDDISRTLSRVSTDCVSSHWVEPNATDRSDCFQKSDMLKSGQRIYDSLRLKIEDEINAPIKVQLEELKNTTAAARKAMNEILDPQARAENQRLINEKSQALRNLTRGLQFKVNDRLRDILRAGIRGSPDYKESSLYQYWVHLYGDSAAQQLLAVPEIPQAPSTEESPNP